MENKISIQSHVKLNLRQKPEQILAHIIQKLYSDSSSPVLIAIGGPGGTGKTTFAEKLSALIPDSSILSLDNYKTSRPERLKKKLSGPHPDANQIGLIKEHLNSISLKKTIESPIYSRESGTTGSYYTYKPQKINLIEGEISTYDMFREYIDFSVFIDSDIKTQLKTRLTRDMDIRGYSLEKAIYTFLESNLVEFSEFGSESKLHSDVHLYCHEDYHLAVESVSEKLLPVLRQYAKTIEPLKPNGCIVPLTTPFAANGSIDKNAFVNHIEWLGSNGITNILVGGTTGEFFSMLIEERFTLLKLAREYFPGIIHFQAGCENLILTLDTVKKAQQLGADTILCLPPYYFSNVPETGLAQYFNTVLANCTVPFILYNYPLHTGNAITPQILKNVKHFGLKDSSGNTDLIKDTPRYFTGGDSHLIESCQKGASGFICSMANVVPELYVKIEREVINKNFEKVQKILDIIKELKCSIPESGIVKIKKLLAAKLDNYPSTVRLPLVQ